MLHSVAQRGMHLNPYVDQLMRNSLRAIVRMIEFEATTLEFPSPRSTR